MASQSSSDDVSPKHAFFNSSGVLLASYADVLRLVTRSWGGTRDKPKNVCVGG